MLGHIIDRRDAKFMCWNIDAGARGCGECPCCSVRSTLQRVPDARRGVTRSPWTPSSAHISAEIWDEIVNRWAVQLVFIYSDSRWIESQKKKVDFYGHYSLTLHHCCWQLYENKLLLMSFNVLWLWGCLQFSGLMCVVYFLFFKNWTFQSKSCFLLFSENKWKSSRCS